MDYISSLISEWMPVKGQRVAVDSHPRLSGIMDTINSTSAHGPETRLPAEFYDTRGIAIMDRITMEEWFSGFKESREYRELGVGSLIGDIVARMVSTSARTRNGGRDQEERELIRRETSEGKEKNIKFALSGCHDSTLAAILSSLGAFEGEKWPPYTSHVAFELFKEVDSNKPAEGKLVQPEGAIDGIERPSQSVKPYNAGPQNHDLALKVTARKSIDDLTPAEKRNLDGFYVRIRYNDRPVVIPGCRLQGKHWRGNETFCTLVRALWTA